jgi:hypothetical protein
MPVDEAPLFKCAVEVVQVLALVLIVDQRIVWLCTLGAFALQFPAR